MAPSSGSSRAPPGGRFAREYRGLLILLMATRWHLSINPTSTKLPSPIIQYHLSTYDKVYCYKFGSWNTIYWFHRDHILYHPVSHFGMLETPSEFHFRRIWYTRPNWTTDPNMLNRRLFITFVVKISFTAVICVALFSVFLISSTTILTNFTIFTCSTNNSRTSPASLRTLRRCIWGPDC